MQYLQDCPGKVPEVNRFAIFRIRNFFVMYTCIESLHTWVLPKKNSELCKAFYHCMLLIPPDACPKERYNAQNGYVHAMYISRVRILLNMLC